MLKLENEKRKSPILGLIPRSEVCENLGVTTPTLINWEKHDYIPKAVYENGCAWVGYKLEDLKKLIKILKLTRKKLPKADQNWINDILTRESETIK